MQFPVILSSMDTDRISAYKFIEYQLIQDHGMTLRTGFIQKALAILCRILPESETPNAQLPDHDLTQFFFR